MPRKRGRCAIQSFSGSTATGALFCAARGGGAAVMTSEFIWLLASGAAEGFATVARRRHCSFQSWQRARRRFCGRSRIVGLARRQCGRARTRQRRPQRNGWVGRGTRRRRPHRRRLKTGTDWGAIDWSATHWSAHGILQIGRPIGRLGVELTVAAWARHDPRHVADRGRTRIDHDAHQDAAEIGGAQHIVRAFTQRRRQRSEASRTNRSHDLVGRHKAGDR